MEYDKIEPVGAVRDDIRTAFLCLVIAKVFGNAKDATIDDFMLDFSGEEIVGSQENTMLEKAKYLQSLFAASGIPSYPGAT